MRTTRLRHAYPRSRCPARFDAERWMEGSRQRFEPGRPPRVIRGITHPGGPAPRSHAVIRGAEPLLGAPKQAPVAPAFMDRDTTPMADIPARLRGPCAGDPCRNAGDPSARTSTAGTRRCSRASSRGRHGLRVVCERSCMSAKPPTPVLRASPPTIQSHQARPGHRARRLRGHLVFVSTTNSCAPRQPRAPSGRPQAPAGRRQYGLS